MCYNFFIVFINGNIKILYIYLFIVLLHAEMH